MEDGRWKMEESWKGWKSSKVQRVRRVLRVGRVRRFKRVGGETLCCETTSFVERFVVRHFVVGRLLTQSVAWQLTLPVRRVRRVIG